MTTKEVSLTIGGVVTTLVVGVAGALTVTGDNVMLTASSGKSVQFESVEQCEAVQADLMPKLDSKTLTAEEAEVASAFGRGVCSLDSVPPTVSQRYNARNLVYDTTNSTVYYSFQEYKSSSQ